MAGQQFLGNAFVSATFTVEVSWGANLTAAPGTWTWTDITADVMHTAKVTISVGRADETSQAQPAQASFTLLNSTGNYTPYRPTGANYPNVRRNTPIRIKVDVGSGATVVFQGYAVGFTPAWDTSANLAVVGVSAAGMLRRLGQLNTPLRSALFRKIQSAAPVAHWPMEDGSGSSRATSAVSGGPALMPIGAGVTFGAAGPGGSEASVDFSPGGGLSGQGPAMSGDFEVTFAYRLTSTASAVMPLQFNTSDGSTWQVIIDPTGTPSISLNGSIGGAPFSSLTAARATNDLGWHAVEIVFKQNGNVDISIGWDGGFTTFGSVLTGTVPHVGSITVAPSYPSGSHAFFMTQLAVIPQPGSVIIGLTSAVSGFTGETASARFSRICTEAAINATVSGSSTVAMGPQPTSALLDVLHECEIADGGLIVDGLDAGLRFVTAAVRENLTAAVTVNAATGQLAPPWAPVDDDQRVVNDATASRPNGGTARYIATAGDLGTAAVGTYDVSITANVSTDDRLIGVAGWAVNLGTIAGLRYPSLAFDFVSVPALAATWLTAGTPGGFRVDVTNVTSEATQAPPNTVTLMVEGWQLALDVTSFTAQVNCSPYDPWNVAVYATDRYDSAASTVTSNIAAGATSMSVTNATNVWTTSGPQFPFDINVAGERMTVTNITGATSPQTFTVTRAVNGISKAQTAGTSVALWNTPRYAH
jgi:hypothetical protein